MTEDRRETEPAVPDILSILPLRGTVLFPHAVLPLGAGRASSIQLIEDAVQHGRLVGAVMQRDPSQENPAPADLHPVGTLMVIHKAIKQGDGTVRVVAQGLGRFRIADIVEQTPFLRARIETVADVEPGEDLESEALVRSVDALFEKVVSLSPTLPDELINIVAGAESAGARADLIAASLPNLATDLKQQLLQTSDVKQRLSTLAAALGKEAEVLALGSKIQSEIHSEMS
ncbi:MAG TPA: LON peptidase substrate-binding domain-containing protein, partial [Candidatus Limnocylindria bacterium]|nr:LON peptidase substrate-binding domain-containing protein [Candidatus Limnocylindria bacterium]